MIRRYINGHKTFEIDHADHLISAIGHHIEIPTSSFMHGYHRVSSLINKWWSTFELKNAHSIKTLITHD
jgi:hypothetical protein